MMKMTKRLSLIIFFSFVLVGCSPPPPPTHRDNVCAIFRQEPQWNWYTQDVQKKTGIPQSVQMAIIHKESSFMSQVKTPRKTIFGIIPWGRQSTASGYSQALDGTWNEYKRSTGNFRASRNSFNDAVKFIGWYQTDQVAPKTNLRPSDPHYAEKFYIAYHAGVQGYLNHNYSASLLSYARSVQRNADVYHRQLIACEASLPKRGWFS